MQYFLLPPTYLTIFTSIPNTSHSAQRIWEIYVYTWLSNHILIAYIHLNTTILHWFTQWGACNTFWLTNKLITVHFVAFNQRFMIKLSAEHSRTCWKCTIWGANWKFQVNKLINRVSSPGCFQKGRSYRWPVRLSRRTACFFATAGQLIGWGISSPSHLKWSLCVLSLSLS